MIPVAGAVRFGTYRVHGFRLSIPFLLLWLLVLPFLVFIVPGVFLAALFMRVNPFQAVATMLHMLAALKGTHIEVENDHFSVLLNIF